MRLGFPVRVLGQRGLRAYDTRRPAHAPHLSVSLTHLRDVFRYLEARAVRFYRMSADLAPFSTHPDLPQFHQQIESCTDELAAIGALARQQRLRLTMHAPLFVHLASEDPAQAAQSAAVLISLTALLDGMGLDPDAVIVTHVGGTTDAAIGRWATCFAELPTAVQRRLVLEHEDDGASLGIALRVHAATGVPLVFDHINPEQTPGTDPRNNPGTTPEDSSGGRVASADPTQPHNVTPQNPTTFPHKTGVGFGR